MHCTHSAPATLGRAAALFLLLCGATSLRAQVAPAPAAAAASAAQLAKYDANKNGVLDPEERAVLETDQVKNLALPVRSGNATETEEIVELSPFQVSGEKDQGYLATSALSGTRLNSRIEDLAASLSVVTKQQLLDTAAVDINDVFLYEANTEGTSQWTSFSVDRGTVSDDIQANPTGATRMRGLSAANTAVDGFASSLPFDTYNVESVEVARGPNSTVFGLGNTGGGVNINVSRARTDRNVTSFGTRGDSYGGYRGNVDFNRVLIKDKLAVRALGVYEEKGFTRKPSYETIRRLQVSATARPFRKTTIRGSFESYRDAYNRPNSTTPRDGISDWITNGRPVYNPLTRTVRFLDGTTPPIGPLLTTADENARLPYGIAPSNTAFTQSPSMYIENGQIVRNEINAMPTATGTGPTSVDAAGLHLLTSNTYYNRYTAQFPLWLTAGVTDKSIYDWTSVNITAPNYGYKRAETYNASLEQIILDTSRQNLAFQAAWNREYSYDNSRSFLGSYGNNGGKLEIDIDINEYLLDGTPNPFFLRPYLGYPRPGFSKSRNATDNYRSMLAYQLNLTREESWLKWLGRHSISGYSEFRSVHTSRLGFTDTLSSDEAWISATGVASSRNANGYRPFVHYMLGDNQGNNVDYGARGIAAPPYSTTLRYYNGVTKQWINEPVDWAEYFYANRPNRRLLSTVGGSWQAFLFKDRIIPTFGFRKDSNRTRDANSAIGPTTATDGFYILPDPKIYGASDWVHNHGKTTSEGVVVKPLNWMHLLYSQSNSFTPGSLAYDVNGQPLNDPRGTTRDYGFQFILFDGRLSIRAQQYETLDVGRGDGTVNTYIQRTLRMDGGPTAATQYPQTVSDPNLAAWYGSELALKNPSWTVEQVMAQVVKDTGVDPVFIASHYGKTHGDRSTATAKGKEIEIAYNPTSYWTLRATVAQNRPLNGSLSSEVQEYINARMPTWTTIRGPYSGTLWWTNTQNSATSPQTFYTNNVLAPISLLLATQNKLKPQTREWRFNALTNLQLRGLTDNRWLKNLTVGGAFRWEDRAVLSYYGSAPDPDGVVRTYDPNRPIWDKSRYYIDFNSSYSFRMFNGKIRTRLQLNVRNVFEDGRLQAVAYNPDGAPYAFRIIDPRQFIFQANFDL